MFSQITTESSTTNIKFTRRQLETIKEALLTEIDSLKEEYQLEARKGYGELEKSYIKEAKEVLEIVLDNLGGHRYE